MIVRVATKRLVGRWYTFDAEGKPQTTEPAGTVEFEVVRCDLVETTVAIYQSITMHEGVCVTPSPFCTP